MSETRHDTGPDRHLLITMRLRQRRAELGLTQKQVVRRLAGCGIRTSNRALSSLEHGAGVDVAKLPELARALDCTVTFLVGLTTDPHSWEPDAAAPPGTPPTPARSRRPRTHPPAESLIIAGSIPSRPARDRVVPEQ